MRIKNLKKINTKALILTGVASAFAVSIFLPTFSWFKVDTASPISVDGNIHGSYFESGDGTAANPFEIARPIQLYYLSWLQEMGYFNEAVYDENAGEYVLKQQYHFYLSKDLDMRITDENDEVTEEYIIPPIGTIKYPFVGSFDGKGHVITDLTITNHYSDYTKDPRHPSGSNTHSDSYEILGLFGVLGTTEATAVVNSSIIEQDGTIHQLQVNNQNVLVSYVAHDTTNYINGNYVQNVYLENVTIVASTDSQHALAGAVAGYSNATVANVGIKDATLSFASGLGAVSTIGTTDLSKYSAFGFVTSDYKRSVDIVNEEVYQPKATAKKYVSNSSGTAWGGSVDMDKMLRRIFTTRHMAINEENGTIPQYPKKITKTYNSDGDLIKTDIVYDNKHYGRLGNTYGGGYTTKTSWYASDKTTYKDNKFDQTQSLGSYYWSDFTDSNGNKCYLSGLTNIEQSTAATEYTFTYGEEETCYYVRNSSDNTGNFIGISATGTLTTSSSTTNATKWHLKNNALIGHAKVTEHIIANNNSDDGQEKIFYLNYDGTNFSLDESNQTNWSYSEGKLIATSNIYSYKIESNYSTGNYLSRTNQNAITRATSSASAPEWIISPAPSNGQSVTISYKNGNTTYYLYNSSGTNLSLSTTSSVWTLTSVNGNYRIRAQSGYYLDYRNNNFSLYRTNANRNQQIMRLTAGTVVDSQTHTFDASSTTEGPFTLSSGTTVRSGQPGYIPLSVEGDSADLFNYDGDAIDVSNFYTSPMNTGYVVGGYYDANNGGSNFGTGNYGDVRISQYPIDRISSSWHDGDFDTFKTINDSSYSNNSDNATQGSPVSFDSTGGNLNFVKFSAAVNNLRDTLKPNNVEATKVSGIHFMNSAIGMDKLIVADKVVINKRTLSNYEMPEDSIDFKLEEKGYINFFAGNYHNDNNSFFALHEIKRDASNHIESIKKIKYIFKNSSDPLADNIYLYENDGSGYSWSDGINDRPVSKNSFTINNDGVVETYEFAFDTKWIGKNTTLIPKGSNGGRDIYYFEIPVNRGEYALGSVDTACGAYLIYLDISAAAQTVQRRTINELFTINTISGDIPYGTQYISSIPNAVIQYNDKNEELKTAIVREGIENIDDLDSYYGSIGTSANGNYTISRNGNIITITPTNGFNSSYIGDGLTLNGGTVTGSTSQRRIRRITDYDYNEITHLYIKQVTTIIIDGTGSTAHNYATTSISYNATSFQSTFTEIARYSYDWTGDGPNFTYNYYLHISAAKSGIEVIFQSNNEDFNLTVEYLAPNYILTCGGNEVSAAEVATAISNETSLPTISIPTTENTFTPDSWYDFTKQNGGYTDNEQDVTPTTIMTFQYTREGEANITQDFVYSGYECISSNSISNFPEVPTTITIANDQYTYTFNLTGLDPAPSAENPIVAIYYLPGSGVSSSAYIVVTASGSQYILFVDESQQQNP